MLPWLRQTVRELARRHPATCSWPRAFTSLNQPSPDDLDTAPPPHSPDTPSLPSYSSPSIPDPPPVLDIPPESDPLLAYLTSNLMHDGKRHAAARRTSRVLLHLHALTRAAPLPILRTAVLRAAPSVRIISHRHGGKTVQKPVPLGEKQRTRFAIQWMLGAAARRSGKQIEERFAREVLAVIKGDSEVLKKKLEVHKLAMVNRCVTSPALLFPGAEGTP